jgi:hypothetical protein
MMTVSRFLLLAFVISHIGKGYKVFEKYESTLRLVALGTGTGTGTTTMVVGFQYHIRIERRTNYPYTSLNLRHF